MEALAKIADILDEAAPDLAKFLRVDDAFLRKLVAGKVIESHDRDNISAIAVKSKKVDKLIEIVKTSSGAYCGFIRLLDSQKKTRDIYKYLKELESKYGLGEDPHSTVSVAVQPSLNQDPLSSVSAPVQPTSQEDPLSSMGVAVQPASNQDVQASSLSAAVQPSSYQDVQASSLSAAVQPSSYQDLQASSLSAAVQPSSYHAYQDPLSSTVVVIQDQDYVEPDDDGGFESRRVLAAPPPTEHQMDKERCYTSMIECQQKGLAYILNVNSVDGSSPRTGSNEDFKNMKYLFAQLGYGIESHVDLPAQGILNTIDNFVARFSEYPQQHYGSSVVVLMSHGSEGQIRGTDGEPVKLNEIYKKFNPKNCPRLNGKPKLFFIQACRGVSVQEAVPLDEYDSYLPEYAIPEDADFFKAFATTEDNFCMRASTGSWFVNAIVGVFLAKAHEDSLTQLMLQANNQVSKKTGTLRLPTGKVLPACQVSEVRGTQRLEFFFHPKGN